MTTPERDGSGHCECEGWIGRWPYQSRNDPDGKFRCSDCERLLKDQYVRADLYHRAVNALTKIEIATRGKFSTISNHEIHETARQALMDAGSSPESSYQ